ncbi:MAG: SdrD B-like domain-containing protein [Anaerolineae bacterium]
MLLVLLLQTIPNAVAAVQQPGEVLVRTEIQAADVPRAPAQTNTLTLRVVNARSVPDDGLVKGEPIAAPYKFQIVVDNTGDPNDLPFPDCSAYLDPPDNTIVNTAYPDSCDWPGVREIPGWAPIYTQGTQDDLNGTTGISLPDGKYVISVLADGYKIDGAHFTVPLADPGLIEVGAHPLPLPPAEMIIQVFHDRAMTNGQFDVPPEANEGLAGFRAMISDIFGEITNDLFGNPICTEYQKDVDGNVILDPDGNPVIQTVGGKCLSDENGIIRIPNIGPIRYDVLVVPPDGQTWIQTTTLEGSWGWDTWLQEAGTGLDNEFLIAAEPSPWTLFGFVAPTNTLTIADPGYGSITGVIMASESYIPSQGGLPHQGDIWGGLMGMKLRAPIAYPWLSLNSLQGGDVAVWVGQGNADGSFEIPNVPPGDYFLSYWDENLHYISDWVQLTVNPSEVTDIGIRSLIGWFTDYSGTVFLDYNENGRRDSGEPGVPDYLVVLRDRDNTEIDRMSVSSVTDANGNYAFEKAYPMSAWMVLEAYSDVYRTTGVTFQASNQPEETTILGPIVDVEVLPILGQWGRLDWGVKFYEPGTNGGIAGTVFYDTMRAEDEARFAGAEPWQPGIPNLEMRLYATVKNAEGVPLTVTTPGPDYGALIKGTLLATTTTEKFVRATGCQPRDAEGNPVTFPSLPPATDEYDCLEGYLMGVQFGKGQAELPGNYGFGEISNDPDTGAPLPAPIPIPPGDYLVEVVIPNDPIFGRPLYEVTREEDLNMFDGDVFLPQIPPSACAGPLHIVDVAGVATDGYPLPWDPTSFSTPVDNPNFADAGGSRFEGEAMPLCNVKMVTVVDQKGVAPIFTLWTPVPIPGRWRGYLIDDLNLSSNPLELTFGEKAGLAHMPIGVYDFTGRLVHTIHTDFHGVYEVLLPSDATYNAPTPSGMLANIYYIYGNDPGQPGNLNADYNPQYRSIGTSFEVYPGVIVPSDLAPTQNGVSIWSPGSQQGHLANCALDDTTPQIYAVSQPYGRERDTFVIRGLGFGAFKGSGFVALGNTRLAVTSWSDRQLTVRVPNVTPRFSAGPYQLTVVADNGQRSVNGLTFHVLGDGYDPPIYEAGAGRTYANIQDAIDAAAGYADPLNPVPAEDALVVVYPGVQVPFTNPLGIWFENPVIYAPVKLQGIGPGGIYADGTGVLGSVLDGRALGGDTAYTTEWRTLVGDIWLNRGGWDGSPVDGDGLPRIYEGPVVTVFASDGEFTPAFQASVDGFGIQGGNQQGFPNNINQIGGGRIPGVPAQVVVQGGGVFVNGYATNLRVTNNLIQGNGGAYASAIRLGTPDTPVPVVNDDIFIGHNRILANGGTNLAGAVGVFTGTVGYEIAYNDVCGNFSVEYGGGISHYGYSPGGSIHHNRIYFNRSYDEGGGIMIAGELPPDPAILSQGSGPVDVYGNLIQGNLSNDDGGGLRFLMAGDYPFNVYNNMIVNNVSTHTGGGISINDAPDVRIYNNTIMKNITTATAMTSNGLAEPAGLASSPNSDLLQATLPVGAPTFSDPLLFNNIFWDNRAGTWIGDGVAGIGLAGDLTPIYYWDLGVSGGGGTLSPTNSLLHVAYAGADGTNLVGQNPMVAAEYDLTIRVFPWRAAPNFIGTDIVAVDVPPNLMGDYHLLDGSPAINAGVDPASLIAPLNTDYDGQPRPSQGGFEIGADETGAAFPNTPILYPLAADIQATVAPQELASINATWTYTAYLPIVFGGTNLTSSGWAGETDAYLFDLITGIQAVDSGTMHWARALYGADQEAYFTFTSVAETATDQDLLLKIGGLTEDNLIGTDTYLINVGYDATDGTILVTSLSPGNVWHTHALFGGINFAVGDTFGARATVGGIVEVYQNGFLIGRADLSAGANAWPYYTEGGWIGLLFEWPVSTVPDGAGLTDFGGGSMPW